MAQYQHEVHGQQFQIEVTPRPVNGDDRIFVARIDRISDGRLIAVRQRDGRREVYGSSELWAMRNARAVLESGVWHEDTIAAA
jgi:outer membrane protein assembly factor BamB